MDTKYEKLLKAVYMLKSLSEPELDFLKTIIKSLEPVRKSRSVENKVT